MDVKIKFEPLIVKKLKNEPDGNQNFPNGKVNYKKFVKIPKASHTKNIFATTAFQNKKDENEKNNSLFKSFKEEPFDLNTQFQYFINSKR